MLEVEHLVKEFIRSETVATPGARNKLKIIKNSKSVKKPFRAVDDISLAAHDGETLGILGPNGAGKTTLLRMLGTLMEPTSGRVIHRRADGSVIEKTEEIKGQMGYLSNNTRLYDKFTIRELLEFMATLYEMPTAHAQERIQAVTETLHLQSFLDNRISRLSTGQMQRANIARCLFADPLLYILDEPTLGLDIMSASAIVDFMRQERVRGKTIVYSTHYLEEAQQMCDRVILLYAGRVIADDTPGALCEKTGEASLRDAFLALIREQESMDAQLGGESW